MALVDMKRTEADMKSGMDAMPAMADGQYPYGLNICLDKEELAKLGITKLPEIGAEFKGLICAQVTRISQSADMTMGDESMSISLQITEMEIQEEPSHPGGESESATTEKAEFKTLLSGI